MVTCFKITQLIVKSVGEDQCVSHTLTHTCWRVHACTAKIQVTDKPHMLISSRNTNIGRVITMTGSTPSLTQHYPAGPCPSCLGPRSSDRITVTEDTSPHICLNVNYITLVCLHLVSKILLGLNFSLGRQKQWLWSLHSLPDCHCWSSFITFSVTKQPTAE